MVAVARRPADLDLPITEEWLRDVKAALGDKRGAQAKLAREIGCSPGTLTDLLQTGKRSHLVARISRALGLPPPTMIVSHDTQEIVVFLEKMGDRGRRLLRDLKSLDRQQLDLTLAMIEQMSRTKD